MANSTIIAQSFTSKNGNKVWKVTVEGSNDAEQTMYCKSPITAIRGMYIMRGRIEGSVISDNSMTKLCNEHYKAKLQKLNPQEAEQTAEEIQQQAEVQTPEEEQLHYGSLAIAPCFTYLRTMLHVRTFCP